MKLFNTTTIVSVIVALALFTMFIVPMMGTKNGGAVAPTNGIGNGNGAG